MALYAIFVTFRVMGRTMMQPCWRRVTAASASAPPPTAIANMQAITQRFGPSHLAFLVVPMVGAFFIDIINAVVIKLFLALPLPVIPGRRPRMKKPTLRWALCFAGPWTLGHHGLRCHDGCRRAPPRGPTAVKSPAPRCGAFTDATVGLRPDLSLQNEGQHQLVQIAA